MDAAAVVHNQLLNVFNHFFLFFELHFQHYWRCFPANHDAVNDDKLNLDEPALVHN